MKVSSSSSSTSSLGNTALAGFGGLASGIDRDSMIEQLTMGTQNKITEAEKDVTRQEWKQEAMRDIIDKSLDLQDKYLGFASGDSLKNTSLYAQNVVTAQGSDEATRFVSASGTSQMTGFISVVGVSQMAQSASIVSNAKGSVTNIETGSLIGADGNLKTVKTSELRGKTLTFGTYDTKNNKFNKEASFTFPASYTDDNGKTVEIDYTGADQEKLVSDLNKAFEKAEVNLNKGKFSFALDNEGKIEMQLEDSGLKLGADSVGALKALGVDTESKEYDNLKPSEGIDVSSLKNITVNKLSHSSVSTQDLVSYLGGKKLSVSFNGNSKDVSILTSEEAAEISANDSLDASGKLDAIAAKLNEHMAEAFGSGRVTVTAKDGKFSFGAADGKSTLVLSTSDTVLRGNLGITSGVSNKVNSSTSLWDNKEKLGLNYGSEEELNEALQHFEINGTKIEGLTSKSSVSEILSKINSTKGAGIKATYLSQSNQFMLIATETGAGREIDLGSEDSVAARLFSGDSMDGKDAKLEYNYGNGKNFEITSSSNTFNIDGLKVTVNGTFGYAMDGDGNIKTKDGTAEGEKIVDTSKTVKFTASANVDAATEKVKKFIEDYNELIKTVHGHKTTKPDREYEPLTDDQKDEMTEKEIEKWETKAKAGILYSDSTLRDYSVSLEGVMTDLLRQGINYEDLKSIGVEMSTDSFDGGTLQFNEDKFREAMKEDPGKVSGLIAGDGKTKGLAQTIQDTITPYATRYQSRNAKNGGRGSYGRLVEQAGTSKLVLTTNNNTIYTSLKEMNEKIKNLKSLLKTEQDRYIKQFTSMESSISDLNTQSMYLSSITG